MPGAAIYCRISRDRAGAGLGVERQEKECRALAEKLGIAVAAVLVDNDMSAYSTRKPRPAYERLLDGIKAGSYSAVIAWHPDRLHRAPKELERFIDIVEAAGIPVRTVQGGEYDLSTAAGRMGARIVGAVARHESEHRSERLKSKHRELAEKGLPGGGDRRYGYEPGGMVVREHEAEIVREMCRRLVSGDSNNGIARDLNQRGELSTTGKPWTSAMIRQTILRPRNIGMHARYGKENRPVITGPAAWPAIVPEELWAAACSVIKDPARRTITTNARRHLLSGIARCGVCGARMASTRHFSGRPLYQCKGPHTCVGRDQARVDALVVGAVIERLSEPGLIRSTSMPADVRDYAAESATLRGRMKDAAKLFARGAIDAGTLETIRADIDAQLDALSAQVVAELPPVAADLAGTEQEVRTRWEGLSLERKRAVIVELYEIRILRSRKGRGFDPNSVELKPR